MRDAEEEHHYQRVPNIFLPPSNSATGWMAEARPAGGPACVAGSGRNLAVHRGRQAPRGLGSGPQGREAGPAPEWTRLRRGRLVHGSGGRATYGRRFLEPDPCCSTRQAVRFLAEAMAHYFLGGLLPLPPPEGPPVLLGQFPPPLFPPLPFPPPPLLPFAIIVAVSIPGASICIPFVIAIDELLNTLG